MANRSASESQWSELMGLLKEQRSIEHAERRAVEFAERAKKRLGLFPPSAEREALLALPDYVIQRDR
jgi:geranylgeranyl pyrophosphate synthase